MLRKIGLFCLGAFCAFQVQASTQILAPNSAIDWELKSGEYVNLKNPTFSTIKARCMMSTESESKFAFDKPAVNLNVEILSGGGMVNNIELKKGQNETIKINDMDILDITVNLATAVKLTNASNGVTLKAKCELLQ